MNLLYLKRMARNLSWLLEKWEGKVYIRLGWEICIFNVNKKDDREYTRTIQPS